MVKYRVGDKVHIKSKEWYNNFSDCYGCISDEIVSFGFNIYMSRRCGMVGTITNVQSAIYHGKEINEYRLDIDNGEWKWSEDMFESVKKGMEVE